MKKNKRTLIVIWIILFVWVILLSYFVIFPNAKNNETNIKLENFSLNYPNRFLNYWPVPTVSKGDCKENNLENIFNIDTSLKNSYDIENIKNDVKQENINWNDYISLKFSDAGAWNIYYNYILATKKNDSCYVINIHTHQANCENYLPLEDWNTEQKINYDKCVENTKNEPDDIKTIKSSFLIE